MCVCVYSWIPITDRSQTVLLFAGGQTLRQVERHPIYSPSSCVGTWDVEGLSCEGPSSDSSEELWNSGRTRNTLTFSVIVTIVTHYVQSNKSILEGAQKKQEWVLHIHWVIACREVGPAVRPIHVRKMTVMSGNQEDRRKEQLDQVSPLYIDSFFPFVCVCLRKRVCLNGFSSWSIFDKLLRGEDAIRPTGGIKRTAPPWWELLWNVFLLKNEHGGYKNQRFSETQRTFTKTGCFERMYGGVSGEVSTAICAFPWTRHILMKSIHIKYKEYVHWWFCYLRQVCQSNSTVTVLYLSDNTSCTRILSLSYPHDSCLIRNTSASLLNRYI